jgi:signal transduction histidine kinase
MKDKRQILIVDDDASARQTMEMLLLREEYDLFFVTSGPEALHQLDTLAPDVILLDVMMPGMDGYEVCQRLKANARWQHIPVILVTALDSKEDLARGLDAGADDFLHKPVNSLELRARIRSMLRIKKRHDDLAAMMRLREDLSNMIVHDIRSPLTTILLYCDLLQGGLGATANMEYVETIRVEVNRLTSLINDMLLMAKMEQGRVILNRTPVDINQLVTAVYESFRPMAQARKIKFVLKAPEQWPRLSLDANLWRRMVDNLVSNALKFSPDGGTVTLQVRYPAREGQAAGPQLRLDVIDEGPGIPAEHRDTIFDKFKIVAAGRRDIAQVGLGLAFCKMVVEAHQGRIAVEANEPQGAIFVVEV